MGEGQRPAVLIVTVQVADEDVDELNRWYEEEHRPEKLSIPGYVSMRRYRAADGSPTFLAIYELDHPDVAAVPAEGGAETSAWMKAVMAKWTRWDRAVWTELGNLGDGP
ncbi:MAG TPA: hypothetical protein VGF11_04040 [Acidimicrobiales bacterium]|jgi:hypothetical protein